MGEIGRQLRAHVDAPTNERGGTDRAAKKIGHNEAIPVDMTAEQVSVYDSVVASAEGEETSSESSAARQNWHLAALWELRRVSLHPDLLAGGSMEIAGNPRDARVILQRSGKLA